MIGGDCNPFILKCLNPCKLATLAALPPSSVKNILYGKSQNPKLLTIKLICDGLGITLSEFFDADDFNQLDSDT